MTDLHELSRNLQNATYPGHEFAQAVREVVAAIVERMEPASEGAKVECPNCGEKTSENHEVVQSDGLEGGRRLFFYTCQQRINELEDRHNRMASLEYQEKVKADMARRAVEIGVDRLVGISAFPVGNCPTCGDLVAPWNKHAKYEGGYTCKPAQPEPAVLRQASTDASEVPLPETRTIGDTQLEPAALSEVVTDLPGGVRVSSPVPSEMSEAVWSMDTVVGEAARSLRETGHRYLAQALQDSWRTHAAQPAPVRMTEELKRVLRKAELDAQYGDGRGYYGITTQVIEEIRAIAAVRALLEDMSLTLTDKPHKPISAWGAAIPLAITELDTNGGA